MILFNFLIILYFTISFCHADSGFDTNWFLKSINTPKISLPTLSTKKIVIAVVDDGVRITHKDLKHFIWENPNEVPHNGIDDDGNGMIDDIHGWDISDNNNIVFPPPSNLRKFYHGTHLAGVITQIANASLGKSASEYISIMPVKTLSDHSSDTYLRDAYKGIDYAVNAGADIILTAWGLGPISTEESRILEEAKKKGVLVIASAGNIPENKKQYPAAFPSVIAVGALNHQNKKIQQSNFGQFIDLSAPGVDIYSASAISDTAYEYKEGTSFSAAMTAITAALIKLKHPEYTANQVKVCLTTSTDNLDKINSIYKGKLGSGKLNIEAAVNCPIFSGKGATNNELVKPQGYIFIKATQEKTISWFIKPSGEFKGLRFTMLPIEGETGESIISFFSGNDENKKLIASYPLASIPQNLFIAATPVYVSLDSNKHELKSNILLKYVSETIDYTKKYCKDIIYLNQEGVIEDGSGDNNYSYHSDCKWLITAPDNQVIKINFTEFNTETKTDFIYFFDGAGTHEEIMAIFSGNIIPPELITWNNQVLIWFVSDNKHQAKGWKATYTFQEQ